MVTKEMTKLSLNIIMIKFYKKCGRFSIVRGSFNTAVLEPDQFICQCQANSHTVSGRMFPSVKPFKDVRKILTADSVSFIDDPDTGIDRILACIDPDRPFIWSMLHTIFQDV